MLVFTLILCICNFSLVYSGSFLDYKYELERGNRIIHASLTDEETGQVWTIEERISSANRIEGKIDITSSKSLVNVFYSLKPGYDTGKRLVMQNQNCELYMYKANWDKQLPGVSKPLTNMILLLGPSFFYRITDSTWNKGKDELIRGALMHSATTIIEKKLNVTVYYKSPQDVAIGVTQPNRIVLTGYSLNSLVEKDISETLILDIYLQSITYQELSESVQPTPGIGCPSYLQDNIHLPAISVDKIHFIAKDISDKQVSLKEIHADEYHQTLRLAETRHGFTQNYLYDYNLGIEYSLSNSGDCPTYAVDLESPGVDIYGKFKISSLLWLNSLYQYLGQVVFEHRSGFIAKVWEAVETDKVLGSGKYDKVVTTLYLTPSTKETILAGYMFVAATRNVYKKDKSGNLELVESIHRDYYDFDVDLPESEYESAFRLGDCFTDPTKRLTLTMHITCDVGKKTDCLKKGEESTSVLRESLMDKIDQTYNLSPLRIVDVEFVFTKERIEVDVTFIEAPSLKDSFPANYLYVKTSSIKKLHETSTKSDEECLKFHSKYLSAGSAVIFCKDGNVCVSTDNPDSIVTDESGGTSCTVYKIPLKNLNRFGQEKTLEEIHDHILNNLIHDQFTLTDYPSGNKYTYEIVDVVANDRREEEKERQLYKLFHSHAKLNQNGFDIIEVSNVNRFSDCYRACSKSEDIFCETFSFCETKDAKSCLVSSLNTNQVLDNLTNDYNCMAYSKNYLTDYIARVNKAFKVPTSVSQNLWLDDCAFECATSPDCFSFEFCNGACTFGGYYTESNTKFAPECTIFTPRLSSKYELTGTKIVTEVLHTELDLDLDQCAVFCYDYNRGDGETCQSFNYCPKSESSASCQLTKYSVSNAKTVTTQSTNCHNYELITKSNSKQVDQDNPLVEKQTVRTTGGGAFGIIMLFLFIGLIVGFVGPYTVMKIKSSIVLRRSSNWSRQINVIEEDQSEMQI